MGNLGTPNIAKASIFFTLFAQSAIIIGLYFPKNQQPANLAYIVLLFNY